MLSFHPIKRAQRGRPGAEPREHRATVLAVETYTDHEPDSFYADLGFHAPS